MSRAIGAAVTNVIGASHGSICASCSNASQVTSCASLTLLGSMLGPHEAPPALPHEGNGRAIACGSMQTHVVLPVWSGAVLKFAGVPPTSIHMLINGNSRNDPGLCSGAKGSQRLAHGIANAEDLGGRSAGKA